MQDNWPSVLFAMAGGVVLSLGTLSTQYAWAFVGLSVTEVITASINVVIGKVIRCVCTFLYAVERYYNYGCLSFDSGTTLNYFLDDRINKAEILFPGVGCFLIAVCLASGVHASNAKDNKAKLSALENRKIQEAGYNSPYEIFKYVLHNNTELKAGKVIS